MKKCSNGGRALMQLDYTQFVSKLEKLTTLRPIPKKDFVDLYVKAYYLQENALEEWIKQHAEVSIIIAFVLVFFLIFLFSNLYLT